jgi:hypothetical protein
VNSAGILEQSLGARNRAGIGLLYWPARLHYRLAELILGIDSWAPLKFTNAGSVFCLRCLRRMVGGGGRVCLQNLRSPTHHNGIILSFPSPAFFHMQTRGAGQDSCTHGLPRNVNRCTDGLTDCLV